MRTLCRLLSLRPEPSLVLALGVMMGCDAAATNRLDLLPIPAQEFAVETLPTHIRDALAHPSRPDADRRKDARRAPGALLALAGTEPGMAVLEMEAGHGYLTEILAQAVDARGRVHVQNPRKLDAFFGTELDARVRRRGFANVAVHRGDFDELGVVDGSVDLALWIQGAHELWFSSSRGVSLGDPQKSFAAIYAALKPGGRFLVVDHSAKAGSGPRAFDKLHRVDEAVVLDLARGAGFRHERAVELFRNPADARRKPTYRMDGRTDQFGHLFNKPAP